MRDIKFRGWCSDDQIMETHDEWKDLVDYIEGMAYRCDVLMQYTGLKDKNGVEIYEGDILHELDPTSFEPKELVFYPEKGCYLAGGCFFTAENIKRNEWVVIGNIYQNPELLEGE